MSIAASVVELDPKEASKSRSGSQKKKSGLTEDSSASSEATETFHIPFFASRQILPGAKNHISMATSVLELDPKEASKSRSGSLQKIVYSLRIDTPYQVQKTHVDSHDRCRARSERSLKFSIWKPPKIRFNRGELIEI